MTGTYLIYGAILALLFLSAFFSASETALTAASRPRLHRLAADGDQRADTVNQLRERKELLIGAILLGNNLVNIMASALATGVLVTWFGATGVVYATIVMTVLILIFAEVLPKSYAIHHADTMALRVGPVLRPFVSVLGPITMSIQSIVSLTFRAFGVGYDTHLDPEHGEQELRGAIDLYEGAGVEIAHERKMLRSVLDLNDVEVGEIMTHRKSVVTIDGDLPPAQILDDVLASPYTRIPLWRDDPDNIFGILHAKALLREVRALDGAVDKLDIERIATTPWFVPETTDLFHQLQAFRERQEHFALVVDEYGALLGIVTLEDILEEIVGEITDEHDVELPGVRPQPDGTLIVNGDVTIRDLNREFEWSLPDEEASTIAGLVMHEARVIPTVGQKFSFFGFQFDVQRRQRNQITLIRIHPPPPDDGDTEAAGTG
ncbi:MAG: HlyC/CorC family transporter [Alphaproteobacteria bacterium]|nr:HlyC/CorC family transporter [Alphaproteobacteria bacterium]